MKAKEMFEKLKFKLYKNNGELRYELKNDYEIFSITFNLDTKTYNLHHTKWLPKDSNWTPQGENKHSATYGYWQSTTIITMDAEFHNAIHQQIKELGWLE